MPPPSDVDDYGAEVELPPSVRSDQPSHIDDSRDTLDSGPARQSRSDSRVPSADDIILAFRSAMDEAGVSFVGPLVADGKIHRVQVTGARKGKKDGFYNLHLDARPAGMFGDWKRGIKQNWSLKGVRPLTREDRRAMSAKIKADRERRATEERAAQAKAAARANAIWDAGMPAGDDHPYLARKGVPSFGLRVGDWPREWHDGDGVVYQTVPNALLVPIRGEGGIIYSLQAIFADAKHLERDKDFLPGGRKQGLYYVIGKPRPAPDTGIVTIIICDKT